MRLFRELRPLSRWLIVLLSLLALVVVVVGGIPDVRQSLLRSAGHALLAQDDPRRAQIIVVSTDALGAGFLEAADLVKAGLATRVAIFDRTPSRVQLEFARRGVQSLDIKALSIQLLHTLGLTDVVVIPSAVAGTEDEGTVLQSWCSANAIHSILFISTPDHSRRTRRVLDRALGQRGVVVTVRYSKYSDFDPDNWWRTRAGQRIEAVEMEKLLLDLLRHPL
jgi:hypothetical protein